MVRAGVAVATATQAPYGDAERVARERGRGMWDHDHSLPSGEPKRVPLISSPL